MARFVIFAFFAALMVAQVAQVAHATVDAVGYLNASGFGTTDLTAPIKAEVLKAAKAKLADVKSIDYYDVSTTDPLTVELAITFTGADEAAAKKFVTDFDTQCGAATPADLPNLIVKTLSDQLTGKTVAKVDCVRKASTTTTTGNSKATAISMIVLAAVGLLQL